MRQNPEVEIVKSVSTAEKPVQAQSGTPSQKTVPNLETSSAAQQAQPDASRREKAASTATAGAASASPPQPILPAPAVQASMSGPANGKALASGISRWKSDEFWSQSYLTKPWNLDQLTPSDEKQLGEQLNGLILRLNPVDKGSGLRRVKETAAPLLERVSRKDIQYQFFVLNSDVPNAFSHPGGYVYVSRKLLEMIPEDEANVLEFVVGHEIAHVELRHAVTCLRDRDVRSFSEGTLQKLYFLIIPYGYPNDFEFGADAWVYERMKQLDRSEHDCLKFLRILDHYAKAHGFEDGRGKPQDLATEKRGEVDGARGISPIDNHMRSHPAAYDRLNHLKALKGRALTSGK